MRKQQEKTDRLSLIILAAFLVLSTSHFMCRFDASGYIEGLFEKAWGRTSTVSSSGSACCSSCTCRRCFSCGTKSTNYSP